MKKTSTAVAKQSRNISQQKLTIGLDLGDRNSWYCVVDEGGGIQLEQRVRTTAEALQEVFGAMPRSRIARAFRKSKSDECSSLRYSSCPSATRSHCAGFPAGCDPPLLHCETSTVPGSYFRKSNPGTVPIPPIENRRSSGSWSPCSQPPSTSLALIHVVGESRL